MDGRIHRPRAYGFEILPVESGYLRLPSCAAAAWLQLGGGGAGRSLQLTVRSTARSC